MNSFIENICTTTDTFFCNFNQEGLDKRSFMYYSSWSRSIFIKLVMIWIANSSRNDGLPPTTWFHLHHKKCRVVGYILNGYKP